METEIKTWEQGARQASQILRAYNGPWIHKSADSCLGVIRLELDDLIHEFYDDQPSDKLFKTSFEAYLGHMAEAALEMLSLFSNISPAVWMDKIVLLVAKKQHDYGHKNITRFGKKGLVLRLHDKYARLANLFERDGAPQLDETVEDTLLDIVGYCLIGIMLDRETFSLDLSGELFVKSKADESDIAMALASVYGHYLGPVSESA